MDDRLRICLWMVGGGAFGSFVGGGFGALTAVFYARSGGAAGTRLARQVVDNFLQSGEHQPSPSRRAILIGAADGSLFLGVLGLIAGALLGWSGRGANGLELVSLGCILLGGAVLFGAMAYIITQNGLPAISCVVVGGAAGILFAGFVLGSDNCLLGTVPGLLVGLIFSWLNRRYAPSFRSPSIGKPIPRHGLDSDTDITGPPYFRLDSDDIRKSDAGNEQ